MTQSFFVMDTHNSPCRLGCPAGIDVKAYVNYIAQNQMTKALEIILETVPFPGTLGRVCHHPCETVCKRQEVDEAIAICDLKRAAFDIGKTGLPAPAKPAQATGKRVAIVGAGPGGLTAAHDLALMGHNVTVYEALPVAGGMLYAGIPAYRLPRNILQEEIDRILSLGIELHLSTPVTASGEVSFDSLKQNNDAVFVALGAHGSKKMNIPNEDISGVIHSTNFLRDFNLGRKVEVGAKVVVVGGGNAAIDAARTALRMGSKVTLMYRRSRVEMPAISHEVDEAENEGVTMKFLTTPVGFEEEKGHLKSMNFIRMELGEPDESGRRRPIPIPNSEEKMKIDTVIISIGQHPEFEGIEIPRTKWNTILVNENTLATEIPGLFAGGDAVTGPASVIEAIAQGRVAAQSIHQYLTTGEMTFKPSQKRPKPNTIQYIIRADIEEAERMKVPHLTVKEAKKGFNEVMHGFSKETAIEEAKRCLSCKALDQNDNRAAEVAKKLEVKNRIIKVMKENKEGLTVPEIAEMLNIGTDIVFNHIKSLYKYGNAEIAKKGYEFHTWILKE